MILDGFFYLNMPEGETPTSSDLCTWRSSDLIFFSERTSQHSVQLNAEELEKFCLFLENASTTTDRLHLEDIKDLHIGLEKEDEGTRNLWFISNRLYMTYNLCVVDLEPLAKFLREN